MYYRIFSISLTSTTLDASENSEDTVVKNTICCADKPFTTVKNNVSIAIKNNKSSVKPFSIGYIYSFIIFGRFF